MNKINVYLRYIIPVLIVGCILYFCFCFCPCCFIKSPVTTVILVRHADRSGTLDALSSAGVTRAQELARILDETNISVIYVSTANRTQQTAAPLATQLGIGITIYNTGNLQALADEIKSAHKGKVILVVGHNNTVPQTINLLGVTPTLTNIPEDDYDNLYIVNLYCRSFPK